MALYKWTRDLNTGIDVIDNQNELHKARKKKDVNAVSKVIDAMIDYTQSHFGFEESLLEEAGYKFLGPHKKVHELFTNRITDFQYRFRKGEDVSEELQELLGKWLFGHIRHDDAAYVADIKAKKAVGKMMSVQTE